MTQKSAVLICFRAEPWNHAWFRWRTYKNCLLLCFLACLLLSRQSHYPWLDHLVIGLYGEELAYTVFFFRPCLTWRSNMSCSTLFSNFAPLWAVSKECANFYVTTPSSETLRLNSLSLFSPFFEGPSSRPIRNCRQNCRYLFLNFLAVTWQKAKEKIHIH